MYLKQLSPLQVMIKNHLIHLGHFDGIPLKGKKDSTIDFMIYQIEHELFLSEPHHRREYYLYGVNAGRQGTTEYNQQWVRDALKERERCQMEKVGRMVVQAKGLATEESIKKSLMTDMTVFGEKIKRIQRNLDIQMMSHLNLQNSMTELEYYHYTLKFM